MPSGSRLRGFTFPETLVTMAVLTLFAAAVGFLLFQGQGVARRLDQQESVLRDKVSLAALLPQLCLDVRPPEWASPAKVFRTAASKWEADYWEGKRDSVLVLEIQGGALTVTTPTGTWTWRALGSLSVGWWTSGDRIIGLVVRWNEGTIAQALHLPWGGRTL